MSLLSTPSNPEYEAWLAHIREAWDTRAAEWDAMLDNNASNVWCDVRRAAEVLRLEAGARVLDAGCGTGQWAVGLAQLGYRVTGVDLAPTMLERARVNADQAGVEIVCREGDIGALPEADGSFNAVYCRCALQFSPDPVGLLSEFRRVLASGGQLVVVVPGALSHIYANSHRRFLESDTHNTHILPWEVEALLNEVGWEVRGGWGTFADGPDSPFGEHALSDLHRRLQQSGCIFWTIIACPVGDALN